MACKVFHVRENNLFGDKGFHVNEDVESSFWLIFKEFRWILTQVQDNKYIVRVVIDEDLLTDKLQEYFQSHSYWNPCNLNCLHHGDAEPST